MYREIQAGDVGGDVVWLDLVVQRHLLIGTTLDVEGRATRSTENAVAILQVALGHPVGGAFDRRYAMWVGSSAGEDSAGVSAVTARVGSSPSGEFAQIRRQLVGAHFVYSVADASRVALLDGTPLMLDVGGRALLLLSDNFASNDLAELESNVSEDSDVIDDALVRRQQALEFGTAAVSGVVRLSPDRWCLITTGDDGELLAETFSPVASAPIEPGIEYVPSGLVGRRYIENPSESAVAACG